MAEHRNAIMGPFSIVEHRRTLRRRTFKMVIRSFVVASLRAHFSQTHKTEWMDIIMAGVAWEILLWRKISKPAVFKSEVHMNSNWKIVISFKFMKSYQKISMIHLQGIGKLKQLQFNFFLRFIKWNKFISVDNSQKFVYV